jgi:hypothetical protein
MILAFLSWNFGVCVWWCWWPLHSCRYLQILKGSWPCSNQESSNKIARLMKRKYFVKQLHRWGQLDGVSHLVCVVLIPGIRSILLNLKISESIDFLLSDIKLMESCSFTIHFKKISMCSKAFEECITCFSELEEVSSSSILSPPLRNHLLKSTN